ncbi:N-acetyltransferase [Teredinibacter sp. KSP-S5-2]|uniref:N-acetyltransferase n=1 Tax=Teredinibacter sp. KSP-S5-2 TaxID=3034506 RepID=UPI0029343998|nr:N-acetyltransferase [Teredinibacter sp. KSP-S5-2]WNO07952.1 N-acetyltransferase [Teredinibacter sp. KSP-S5-2]
MSVAVKQADVHGSKRSMIRNYKSRDMNSILGIWLSASVEAHHFIPSEFWQSKVEDMRNLYIPVSETYVFEADGKIVGFYCLYGDTLAAIFVLPNHQGKGIGSALMNDAKKRRKQLQLTVYKMNSSSTEFYKKHGFVIAGEQIDTNTGQPELMMEYRM